MSRTDDTMIGGQQGVFPETSRSAIIGARSEDPAERARAFELIVAAYWKPVYKYIRIKWHKSNEDAKDLTQEFFARAIDKGFFDSYDPARSRFRTFVRVCLEGYLANEDKAARRLKRGGGAGVLSFDFETAESELRDAVPPAETVDDYFEREWVRTIFGMAVEALREQCESTGKATYYRLFERYYLDDSGRAPRPTYQSLAAEFSLPVTSVTNHLSFTRREFRRSLLKTLRQLTATEEEFRREARSLLGDEIE